MNAATVHNEVEYWNVTINGKAEPSIEEIGGYFGLDLPDYGDPFTDTIRFQSGRAAIRATFECNEINHVLLPAYICDSIFQSAVDAGVTVEAYELDDLLYPKSLPRTIPDRHAVLYVNYFGLCQKNVFRLIEDISPERLIIDNSHALFAPRADALAAIYSPRKFVGLPDGGLLKASPKLRITAPAREDRGSFNRMTHLLLRMAHSAGEGYAFFDEARKSLSNTAPLAMSRLTQRLMKSIRWDQVIESRRRNYKTMAQMLDAVNETHWTLGDNDVPLCYPLTLRGCNIIKTRKDLAKHNVFTATYWPDALPRIRDNSIEASLVHQTLFLPIDQRMEKHQVKEVARLALKLTAT